MSRARKTRVVGTRKEQAERQVRVRNEMRRLGATTSRDLRRTAADWRCDEEIRTKACWLLGQVGDRDAAATLLRVAKRETNKTVAWEAFSVLGLIGNRSVTPALLDLLEKTSEKGTTAQVVYALWFLGDHRAAPTLLKILKDPEEDDSARGFAAEGLGDVRPSAEILDALCNALSDSSVNVRMSALCALSAADSILPDQLRTLFESKVIPAIKQRLHDHAACPGEETVADLARTVLENWNVAIGPEGATNT